MSHEEKQPGLFDEELLSSSDSEVENSLDEDSFSSYSDSDVESSLSDDSSSLSLSLDGESDFSDFSEFSNSDFEDEPSNSSPRKIFRTVLSAQSKEILRTLEKREELTSELLQLLEATLSQEILSTYSSSIFKASSKVNPQKTLFSEIEKLFKEITNELGAFEKRMNGEELDQHEREKHSQEYEKLQPVWCQLEGVWHGALAKKIFLTDIENGKYIYEKLKRNKEINEQEQEQLFRSILKDILQQIAAASSVELSEPIYGAMFAVKILSSKAQEGTITFEQLNEIYGVAQSIIIVKQQQIQEIELNRSRIENGKSVITERGKAEIDDVNNKCTMLFEELITLSEAGTIVLTVDFFQKLISSSKRKFEITPIIRAIESSFISEVHELDRGSILHSQSLMDISKQRQLPENPQSPKTPQRDMFRINSLIDVSNERASSGELARSASKLAIAEGDLSVGYRLVLNVTTGDRSIYDTLDSREELNNEQQNRLIFVLFDDIFRLMQAKNNGSTDLNEVSLVISGLVGVIGNYCRESERQNSNQSQLEKLYMNTIINLLNHYSDKERDFFKEVFDVLKNAFSRNNTFLTISFFHQLVEIILSRYEEKIENGKMLFILSEEDKEKLLNKIKLIFDVCDGVNETFLLKAFESSEKYWQALNDLQKENITISARTLDIILSYEEGDTLLDRTETILNVCSELNDALLQKVLQCSDIKFWDHLITLDTEERNVSISSISLKIILNRKSPGIELAKLLTKLETIRNLGVADHIVTIDGKKINLADLILQHRKPKCLTRSFGLLESQQKKEADFSLSGEEVVGILKAKNIIKTTNKLLDQRKKTTEGQLSLAFRKIRRAIVNTCSFFGYTILGIATFGISHHLSRKKKKANLEQQIEGDSEKTNEESQKEISTRPRSFSGSRLISSF